jgi:hypothetical protein
MHHTLTASDRRRTYAVLGRNGTAPTPNQLLLMADGL